MNEDFIDLLRALLAAEARFLVVGAHALASFGAPIDAAGLRQSDLEQPDRVIQIGLPPRRIDVMTEISGVRSADAWEARVVHAVEGLSVPFIGRDHLVQNKRATGRAKDLADLEELGES